MSIRKDTSNAIKHSFFRTTPPPNPVTLEQVVAALRPFVIAYNKKADHIGDSDLSNEQPRYVDVTLGDCRKAARLLARLA